MGGVLEGAGELVLTKSNEPASSNPELPETLH